MSNWNPGSEPIESLDRSGFASRPAPAHAQSAESIATATTCIDFRSMIVLLCLAFTAGDPGSRGDIPAGMNWYRRQSMRAELEDAFAPGSGSRTSMAFAGGGWKSLFITATVPTTLAAGTIRAR